MIIHHRAGTGNWSADKAAREDTGGQRQGKKVGPAKDATTCPPAVARSGGLPSDIIVEVVLRVPRHYCVSAPSEDQLYRLCKLGFRNTAIG